METKTEAPVAKKGFDTNKYIADAELKKILFDDPEPSERDIVRNANGIIESLNKLLIISFFVMYIKWQNEYVFSEKKFNTEGRITGIFESVYSSEAVTGDLIAYTFTEMMIEYANKGENSFYSEISDAAGDPNIFQFFSKVHKIYKQSSQKVASITSTSEMTAVYYNILRSLPLAKDLKLINENNSLKFKLKNSKEVYPFTIKDTSDMEVLKIDGNGRLCYLREIKHLKDGSVLIYSDFDERNIFHEKKTEKVLEPEEYLNAVYSKKSYANNYRYIQKLSLIISDSISEEVMQHIVDCYDSEYHFQEMIHGDVFTDDILKRKQYWDNIITVLMVEEGASEILDVVLNASIDCFDKIAVNMHLRFGKRVNAEAMAAKYRNLIQKERNLIKNQLSSENIGRHLGRVKKEIAIKIIISEIVGLYEPPGEKKEAVFVETLAIKHENLIRFINEPDIGIESKVIKINTELEKIFRFLFTFYSAIIKYADTNSHRLGQENFFIPDIKLREFQSESQNAFFAEARAAAAKCCKMTLGQLVGNFTQLCLSFYNDSDQRHKKTNEKSQLLFSLIGREYICDTTVLNDIISFDESKMQSGDAPKTIIEYINAIKHDSIKYSPTYVKTFFNKVQMLYQFLIFNKDYQTERLNRQIVYDPVYPYVVKYNNKANNKDGCSIRTCYVDNEISSGYREINILTEYHYDIGENYYCIPNAQGSNNRWWIDPLLINCREFDEILLKAKIGES